MLRNVYIKDMWSKNNPKIAFLMTYNDQFSDKIYLSVLV